MNYSINGISVSCDKSGEVSIFNNHSYNWHRDSHGYTVTASIVLSVDCKVAVFPSWWPISTYHIGRVEGLVWDPDSRCWV